MIEVKIVLIDSEDLAAGQTCVEIRKKSSCCTLRIVLFMC